MAQDCKKSIESHPRTRLADEAVDVPRSAHGVDRLVGDGLGAALALGAGGVDVALLAVRVPLVLVEAALGRELGPARPAREARVVPRLVHRFHTALQSRLMNNHLSKDQNNLDRML